MSNTQVAIVDYGVGNLFNIKRALDAVSTPSKLTSSKKDIESASHLLLPGVGAFEPGMSNLRDKGLDQVIIDFVKTGKPVMGICLGMQLLLTKSFENGECEGLNIIAGEVSALKPTGAERVPQIGWNTIVKKEDSLKSSILDSLESKPYFYFLHSYQVQVSDSKCSLAQTTYGPNIFSSVIVKDNVSGCQFHPELSAVNGLAIFKNFVKQ